MFESSMCNHLKFKVLALFGFGLASLFITPLRAEPLPPEDIYTLIQPSVLTLKVQNAAGERFTGSAFLAVAQDIAVTAWHVIYDATNVMAIFADGRKQPVLGWVDKNEQHDLALIQLKNEDQPLLKLATATPRIGSRLYIMGAPKGYGFSIAEGLLSQIQNLDGYPQYQVSCPFSTGNSGGPLLNAAGAVVGVASWSKRGAQNLNFAVPVHLLSELDPSRPVVPWANALPSDMDAVASETLAGRELVLESELPAAAPLPPDFIALRKLLEASIGHSVTIVVRRDGKERKFTFVVPE